ncbi:hypothetical protein [Leptospira koniambonensis]|nr:hypothetical protein [Leptospira koniambonensis]
MSDYLQNFWIFLLCMMNDPKFVLSKLIFCGFIFCKNYTGKMFDG